MKKYIISIISAIILAVSYNSCSEDEIASKDNALPTVSEIKINWGDTLRVGSLTLQDDREGGRIPDTLIVGKPALLSAIFEDDLALSSYRVVLSFDSISQPQKDSTTMYYNYACSYGDISGMSRSILTKKLVIPSIPDNVFGKPTRTGDYFFKIIVMDLSGKVDSAQQKVKVINRNQWPIPKN